MQVDGAERALARFGEPSLEGTLRNEPADRSPLVRLPASQRSEDYPKDYLAPLTIAADAPTGARPWRVWNAQGATPARKFIVGDLPEVIEHVRELNFALRNRPSGLARPSADARTSPAAWPE